MSAVSCHRLSQYSNSVSAKNCKYNYM